MNHILFGTKAIVSKTGEEVLVINTWDNVFADATILYAKTCNRAGKVKSYPMDNLIPMEEV